MDLETGRLDGWVTGLSGIYKYYKGKFNWEKIQKKTIRALIEMLGKEAGLFHPRMLGLSHFRHFEVPGIRTDLFPSLYDSYYRRLKGTDDTRHVIDFMLDDIGVGGFESIPWDQQLLYMKNEKIRWQRIPRSTQLRLLNLFMSKLEGCPHLRAIGAGQMQKSDDRSAKDNLLFFLDPLIRGVVLKYSYVSTFDFDEFMQIARLRALEIIKRYDPKISKLTTFLTFCLNQDFQVKTLREAKKKSKEISLETPVVAEGDKTLKDCIIVLEKFDAEENVLLSKINELMKKYL